MSNLGTVRGADCSCWQHLSPPKLPIQAKVGRAWDSTQRPLVELQLFRLGIFPQFWKLLLWLHANTSLALKADAGICWEILMKKSINSVWKNNMVSSLLWREFKDSISMNLIHWGSWIWTANVTARWGRAVFNNIATMSITPASAVNLYLWK